MDRRGKPGKRRLSEEEHQLWDRVKATSTPLRPTKSAGDADIKVGAQLLETENMTLPLNAGAAKPNVAPKMPKLAKLMPNSSPVRSPEPLPLTGLDRRTEQRLKRGRIEVDGTLDLHGLTQDRAHSALRAFLITAQARGDRMVLVITGKGRTEGVRFESETMWGSGRGILRRLVPEWLAQPEFRVYVSGYRDAHQRHGGGGAIYVRIRRRR